MKKEKIIKTRKFTLIITMIIAGGYVLLYLIKLLLPIVMNPSSKTIPQRATKELTNEKRKITKNLIGSGETIGLSGYNNIRIYSVDEIFNQGIESLEGEIIKIKGTIKIGGGMCTMIGCNCCNGCGGFASIKGTGNSFLRIDQDKTISCGRNECQEKHCTYNEKAILENSNLILVGRIMQKKDQSFFCKTSMDGFGLEKCSEITKYYFDVSSRNLEKNSKEKKEERVNIIFLSGDTIWGEIERYSGFYGGGMKYNIKFPNIPLADSKNEIKLVEEFIKEEYQITAEKITAIGNTQEDQKTYHNIVVDKRSGKIKSKTAKNSRIRIYHSSNLVDPIYKKEKIRKIQKHYEKDTTRPRKSFIEINQGNKKEIINDFFIIKNNDKIKIRSKKSGFVLELNDTDLNQKTEKNSQKSKFNNLKKSKIEIKNSKIKCNDQPKGSFLIRDQIENKTEIEKFAGEVVIHCQNQENPIYIKIYKKQEIGYVMNTNFCGNGFIEREKGEKCDHGGKPDQSCTQNCWSPHKTQLGINMKYTINKKNITTKIELIYDKITKNPVLTIKKPLEACIDIQKDDIEKWRKKGFNTYISTNNRKKRKEKFNSKNILFDCKITDIKRDLIHESPQNITVNRKKKRGEKVSINAVISADNADYQEIQIKT